ncbi:MAG: hypothetical protein V4692_03490, partial [Bdellovibrionota bacterium]
MDIEHTEKSATVGGSVDGSTDLTAILAEWNSSHGDAYRIRECDLNWNQSKQCLLDYKIARIAGVSVIYGTATAQGIAAGLPSKNLWIHLWGRIADGHEDAFVSSLESFTKTEGYSKLMIGGDEFHSVSGIPYDEPAGMRLREACTRAGFTGSEAADFCG